MFSAMWHGIYLTYYLGFFQWGLVANISKFFYKASYKFGPMADTVPFKIFTWIVSNLFMNYLGMLMCMLSLSKGITYYNNLYWFGTFVIVGTHTFFSVTRWGQRPPKT